MKKIANKEKDPVQELPRAGQPKIKYSEDQLCPMCGKTKELRYLNANDEKSDVICTACGAVFYNARHGDYDLRGLFTGRYEHVSVEKLYLKETK